jgi:hypothetical protein
VSCSIGEQAQSKFDEDGNCTRTCVKVPPKRKLPPTRKITLPPVETQLPAPEPTPPPAPPTVQPEPPPVAQASCEPGKFVVEGKDGPECLTADEIAARREKLEALLAELLAAREVAALPPVETAPPATNVDAELIGLQLEVIRDSIEKLPKVAELAVKKVEELKQDVADVASVQAGQSARLDENDRRLAELGSSPFGLQIGINGGGHFLVPYGTPLWDVGPELELLFRMTDGWRVLLGGGAGYGGKNSQGNGMVNIEALVGIQPAVTDLFHFAIGAVTEQRLASSLQFSSYGGFVEPKLCPGNGGALKPHRFCFGLRLIAGATRFKGPETGKVFTQIDGSAGLNIGYAFMPR